MPFTPSGGQHTPCGISAEILLGAFVNLIIFLQTTQVRLKLSKTWLERGFDRQDKSKIKEEVPKKLSQTVTSLNPLIALRVKCFGRGFCLAEVWRRLFLLSVVTASSREFSWLSYFQERWYVAQCLWSGKSDPTKYSPAFSPDPTYNLADMSPILR